MSYTGIQFGELLPSPRGPPPLTSLAAAAAPAIDVTARALSVTDGDGGNERTNEGRQHAVCGRLLQHGAADS